MQKPRKILIPTDFSRCADQAFSWAAQLAVDYDAELHALHVEPIFRPLFHEATDSAASGADDDGTRSEIVENRMSSLLSGRPVTATDPSRPSPTPRLLTATRRAFAAAPAIVDYAGTSGIDLIVLGTQGRRGIGHLALGSVAEEVVRIAACPVLTVREREQPKPIETTRTILVPLDGSEHAEIALRHARELGALYDASLQLLHVVEAPVYPSFYALDDESFKALLSSAKVEAKDQLRQSMLESEGPRVPFDTFIVEGAPAAAILDFAARRESDLIVLPTHGLNSLRRFFLGSVAEKVVRRSPTPVLSIPVLDRDALR